jgi:hypothetical protein
MLLRILVVVFPCASSFHFERALPCYQSLWRVDKSWLAAFMMTMMMLSVFCR